MKKFIVISICLLIGAVSANPFFNSFNSGELSPLVKYRVDLDKRYMGVEALENMFVKPQGAAERRPGTKYIANSPLTILGDTLPTMTHDIPISTVEDLNNIRTNMDGNYYLVNDIDASSVASWNGGMGFIPIGTYSSDEFTGQFDGQGYTISNLYMNKKSGTDKSAGLFSSIKNSTIYNVIISDCNIIDYTNAAILAGNITDSNVQGVRVSGWLWDDTGGLKGGVFGSGFGSGNIKNCTSDVEIIYTDSAPYCGLFCGNAVNFNFTDCYATGSITMTGTPYYNGGFAGQVNTGGTFLRCSVDGIIPDDIKQSSTEFLTNGGFVGNILGGTFDFSDCYYVDTMNLKPFGGKNEIQKFTPDDYTASGGHYHIIYNGNTTGTIAYNANDATVQAALDATFGSGNFLWYGSQYIAFIGDNTRVDADMVTCDATAITGPTSPYAYTFGETQKGVYPTNATAPEAIDKVYDTVNNENIRLIPFEYSNTDSYIIEMGNQYFKFYREGGKVLDGNSIDYITRNPFISDQIRQVQYVQSNDVMYLVHPEVTPQKLSRFGHADWQVEDVEWQWGPFLEENTEDTTITPTGISGSITLNASADIFYPDQVGSYWLLKQKPLNTYVKGTLASDVNSATVTLEGEGLLTLEGTWVGLVTMEKSIINADSWEAVYPKLNGNSANIEYSFNEEIPGYEYRVTMSDFSSGSCAYTLTSYNTDVSGYVQITRYVDANTVNANVKSELASATATTKWSEGAWSKYRGFPRAICLYQNRLVLAGTDYQPNGVWLSQSSDFENMRATSLDNSAIVYEVGSAKQNPILWLQDRNGIIAGTSGSVIRIFSQSSTSTLTPASIGSEMQTQSGSCDIQAQATGDSIIFVDRNRKIVRDMIYDLQSDGFVSPQLSILAEHITDPGIVELAIQSRPDAVIWFVKSDGDIISLTYDRTQNIVAWASHETDGVFESIAVIPGLDEDEVWVAVKRPIGDANERYIEQFQPQDWGSDTNDCWFVDSGLKYEDDPCNVINGLDHLEGKLVQIFYDGNSVAEANVVDGKVTLDVNVAECTIGLPYTSTLMSFPIEVGISGGYSIGYKKKIYDVYGCFYKTMKGEYGTFGPYAEATMYPIPFSTWPDELIGTDRPFTGQINLPIDGGWNYETQMIFIQDEPFPFNITGYSTKVEISAD